MKQFDLDNVFGLEYNRPNIVMLCIETSRLPALTKWAMEYPKSTLVQAHSVGDMYDLKNVIDAAEEGSCIILHRFGDEAVFPELVENLYPEVNCSGMAIRKNVTQMMRYIGKVSLERKIKFLILHGYKYETDNNYKTRRRLGEHLIFGRVNRTENMQIDARCRMVGIIDIISRVWPIRSDGMQSMDSAVINNLPICPTMQEV